jgi:hypothetical protein
MSLLSYLKRAVAMGIGALLFGFASVCSAQSTSVSTEYLMTLYAPLDAPQIIDNTLFIYNVRDGGWAKGPKISGKLIPPGADWLRMMPAGNARLDVRLTLKTDDGALVYVTYNGIISHTKESWDRLMKGEVLTSKDHYFMTAPTMQTSAEQYAWLNHVQCVGKIVEVKVGDNSYVKYDIFIVR